MAIVVVDEHPIWIAGIRSALSGTHFRVVGEVRSGGDAAAVAARTKPRLVIFGPGIKPEERHLQAIQHASPGVALVVLADRDERTIRNPKAMERQVELLPCVIECNELVGALASFVATTTHLERSTPMGGHHGLGLLDPLTSREMEVLRLMTSGLTNAQIADTLFIARSTAKTHVERIIRKLGVVNRVQAAAWAIEHGLTAPDNPVPW